MPHQRLVGVGERLHIGFANEFGVLLLRGMNIGPHQFGQQLPISVPFILRQIRLHRFVGLGLGLLRPGGGKLRDVAVDLLALVGRNGQCFQVIDVV